MKLKCTVLFCLLALFLSCDLPLNYDQVYSLKYPIIPEPKSLITEKGNFLLSSKTKIEDQTGEASELIDIFNSYFSKATGLSLQSEAVAIPSETNTVIRLQKEATLSNGEGYLLEVAPTQVVIKAKNAAGWYYGLMSLLQLLPPKIFSKNLDSALAEKFENNGFEVPCCQIADEPRFGYRGLLLDESRHFFGKACVLKILDEMGKVKMNRFHWHLTDDGGFRFPFSGQVMGVNGDVYDFDKLMAETSWRGGATEAAVNYLAGWSFCKQEDANFAFKHGGYYTREDLAEIIAFAKARNITIIPEFCTPGHCKPLYDTFPSLRCDQENHDSKPGKDKNSGTFKDLCPSNPDTLIVLKYMINQIAEVFTESDTIHMGADEVYINNHSWYDVGPWWFCNRCQNEIRKITNDPKAVTDYPKLQLLQSHFLGQIEDLVHQTGKKMAIWNEGMHGHFKAKDPTKTMLWYWNGVGDLRSAKEQGMAVVNNDTWNYYLDMYQSKVDWDNKIGGNDWGGTAPIIDLKRIYNHDPVREQNFEKMGSKQTGIQCCMWNEHTIAFEKEGKKYDREGKLMYNLFPRMIALAERAWSPDEKAAYNHFVGKINWHFDRLDAAGIHHYCADERILKK